MSDDDNLHIFLSRYGSEKYRYSPAEFLTASTVCKTYRHTLKESYPLHWLEYYELMLVTQGEGVHGINGLRHQLKPGTLCLLTPADFHTVLLAPGDEITIHGVVFDEAIIGEDLRRWLFQNHDYYHIQLPGDLSRKLLGEFEQLYEEDQAPDLVSRRLIAGALERILLYVVRHSRQSQPRPHKAPTSLEADFPASIQQALLYIHHYFRQPLSLKEAARRACLAPNYFSERFHTLMGVSFQHYLQGLRLRFAAKLLAASDLQVSEILLASGFRDQTHFGRAFKKRYSVSPRQYRLMARVSEPEGKQAPLAPKDRDSV